MVIPFGIASVGPGLIFQDEYARLHNFFFFEKRLSPQPSKLPGAHPLSPLKKLAKLTKRLISPSAPLRRSFIQLTHSFHAPKIKHV